ncbi:MAG: TonB-dependent receptor, partial [SAR86 cluster bacterium]|nr:TonB-dependent receptor [SAR86 cluster bacterium]
MNKYLLSLLLLAPLTTVIAQESNEKEEEAAVEEVVVTGIRSSLKNAIDIKRKNVGVVDAITAEDIGKFPDGNLAESLSRIVGVAIDRSNVEGSKVAVRGLGPEFNLVTLNGRQMPTVPGTYGGGRSFDFGDISSHGVSAVEVYKSANAALPTGGIGATINMVTTKPLEVGKTVGSFAVKAMIDTENEQGDEVTPELDFVFSTIGEDYNGGSWGLSFSGTHQVRHNREEGTNEITWNPSTVENYLPPQAVITSTNQREDNAFFYPRNLVYKYKDNERVRNNFQTAFQYELGRVRTTIDYTYSNVDFASTGVENGAWFSGWNARNVTINENGAAIYSDDVGQEGKGREFFNNILWAGSVNRNNSLGFNIDFQVNEDLNLTFDMHDSSATIKSFGNSIMFSNARWSSAGSRTDGTGPFGPVGGARMGTATFDFTGSIPILDYTAFDENDLQNGITTPRELVASDLAPVEALMDYQEKSNFMDQVQLLGTWDNNQGLFHESLSRVKFGYSSVNQKFRRAKANEKLLQGKLEDGNPDFWNNALTPDFIFNKVNEDNYLGSGSDLYYFNVSIEDAIRSMQNDGYLYSEDAGLAFWNVRRAENWPCGTVDDAQGQGLYSYDTQSRTDTRGVLCAGDFDSNDIVEETIDAIFVNAYFEHTTKKGQPLNIEIGLRYEEVDQASTGTTSLPIATTWCLFADGNPLYDCNFFGMLTGEPEVFTETGEGSYILPNINGSFEFAENQIFRFALSKTNSRPDLEQMRATVDTTPYSSQYPVSVIKGNPNLQPYEAENLDLAYEYYYADGSYFAVNYFRKNINGWHGSQNGSGSFNGVTDIGQSQFFLDLLELSQNYTDANASSGAEKMCQVFSWSCGVSEEG